MASACKPLAHLQFRVDFLLVFVEQAHDDAGKGKRQQRNKPKDGAKDLEPVEFPQPLPLTPVFISVILIPQQPPLTLEETLCATAATATANAGATISATVAAATVNITAICTTTIYSCDFTATPFTATATVIGG